MPASSASFTVLNFATFFDFGSMRTSVGGSRNVWRKPTSVPLFAATASDEKVSSPVMARGFPSSGNS